MEPLVLSLGLVASLVLALGLARALLGGILLFGEQHFQPEPRGTASGTGLGHSAATGLVMP